MERAIQSLKREFELVICGNARDISASSKRADDSALGVTDGLAIRRRTAADFQLYGRPLFGAEGKFEFQPRRGRLRSRSITSNASLPDNVIQSFIRKNDGIAFYLFFEPPPFPFSDHTANFEDVGEVCLESDSNRNLQIF